MPMYEAKNARFHFSNDSVPLSVKNPQAEIYAGAFDTIYFASGHYDSVRSDFGGRRFAVIKHREEVVSQSFGLSPWEWITDEETSVYRGPVPDLWSSACYPLGVPEVKRGDNVMLWVEEAQTINNGPWENDSFRRYCEHDVRLTAPIKHPRGGF